MSSLDQPLLIANVNYHSGHQFSMVLATEQGWFAEEGLERFEYDARGLIPYPYEREGLALAMREHGVDVATAVNVETAVHQRALGADLFVVAGWRTAPDLKYFGARHVRDLTLVRGGRVGVREVGSLEYTVFARALARAGVDPATEVEWISDPVLAYRNNPDHLELLRSGKLDAMPSSPPYSRELEREGYPVLFDPNAAFPGGRPEKVTVATGATIERRADELGAFLRATIRAFWYMRDVAHLAHLQDLEARVREASHNDEERRIRILTGPEKIEGWALPIDGGVSRSALEGIVAEMRDRGDLSRAIGADEILRSGPVEQAFRDVSARPELQPALAKARVAAEKYGF